MKKILFIAIVFLSTFASAQDTLVMPVKYTAHNKGKFYIYWGGNRETFSKSDITFSGNGYDFTLQNVSAHDKPKGWHIDYINPTRMTIPQTNFRIGYFITDKYNVSVGVDHMKYVMTQDQVATINGTINLPENDPAAIHNGSYYGSPKVVTEDFLTFEHTDGLNYVNAEIARVDDLSKFIGLPNTDKFQINITEGLGGGLLYPKTNAKVLSKPRHDNFHVSGYGVSAKAGLNFTFFKYFFIQGELKGGYINMNSIRTTYNTTDKASQEFFFLQRIITVGGIFRI